MPTKSPPTNTNLRNTKKKTLRKSTGAEHWLRRVKRQADSLHCLHLGGVESTMHCYFCFVTVLRLRIVFIYAAAAMHLWGVILISYTNAQRKQRRRGVACKCCCCSLKNLLQYFGDWWAIAAWCWSITTELLLVTWKSINFYFQPKLVF